MAPRIVPESYALPHVAVVVLKKVCVSLVS